MKLSRILAALALSSAFAFSASTANAHMRVAPLAIVTTARSEAGSAAQYDAQSIAQSLESSMLSGAGVNMKFTLAGEGKISVSVDLKSHRIRMESPSTLIVSDGSTIWNENKRTRQVTIDNVSGTNSAFRDPASVFRFASNYTSRLVSSKGSQYVIELTPKPQLQSLLKSTGDMQRLELTVQMKGKTPKITKAVASSSRGESRTSAMSISSLRAVKSSDFVFSTPANAKVIDLRE